MGKSDKDKSRKNREERLERARIEDEGGISYDGDALLDFAADREPTPEETAADEEWRDEDSREEQAATVVEEARIEYIEQAPSDMIRIEIDVSVNGIPSGQKLTVERSHPFYSGLLDQKLAHIIGAED